MDGLGEIVEITQDTKGNCYKFVVEQGTVLANDILVGAFYSQNDDKKLKEDILKTTKISVPSVN